MAKKLCKNDSNNINLVLEAASHKAAVRLLTTNHEYCLKLVEPDMRDTAREVGTNS